MLSDQDFQKIRDAFKMDCEATNYFIGPDSGPLPMSWVPNLDRLTTMQEITEVIARKANLSVAIIFGDSRARTTSTWRGMAMHIGRHYLGYSAARVARSLNMDHSSILAGSEKFKEMMESKPLWKQRLNGVLRELS